MKVYFNNSCKICKAEIDIYKKEKIQDIDWIDITDNTLATKETSKNSKELLRRLHVKDGEQVLEGAEAFLILWKKMPKYKFLYNFFKLPIIFNIFSSFSSNKLCQRVYHCVRSFKNIHASKFM